MEYSVEIFGVHFRVYINGSMGQRYGRSRIQEKAVYQRCMDGMCLESWGGDIPSQKWVGRSVPLQTSAPYNILGTTTTRYNLLICHPETPPDVLANLLHCLSHSLPFPIAAAICSFHLNSLSIWIPRNLTVDAALIVWLLSTKSCLGNGILLCGLVGSFTLRLDRSNSWNFSTLKLQLCNLAHSIMPPSLDITSFSFPCVVLKSGPVTKIAVSLTKRKPVSLFGLLNIFSIQWL